MSGCSLLDEVCHGGISDVTFEAAPTLDLAAPALECEFHTRTQGAEEMVADSLPAAHEEAFGVADLFDGTMAALAAPVFPAGLPAGVPSHFEALFLPGVKGGGMPRVVVLSDGAEHTLTQPK